MISKKIKQMRRLVNEEYKYMDMDSNFKKFIEAINQKKLVKIKVNTDEKGVIERICVPYDFGPSRKYHDGKDRYHFLDLDSPDGPHNLSKEPEDVISIEVTDEGFDPGDYVTWTPSWHIARDWGIYS